MKMYIIRVFLGMCFIEIARLQHKRDYENVLYEIFTERKYDKNVLPKQNSTHPVSLEISLIFLGLEEIDETKEKMVSTGYLEMSWLDPSLWWDSEYFGDLRQISVRQDFLWTPDLFLVNGVKKFNGFGGSFYYIKVDHLGYTFWLPFDVFESRCSLDTRYFPFDKQTCHLRFSVWSHPVTDLKIKKGNNPIKFDRIYKENSVWKVLSTDCVVNNEDRNQDSNIIFTFNLQRKPFYYIMNIIIPIVFLGFLNGIVFVIPAESGEKMGYSITVFLSLAVFLSIIGTHLPVNSEQVTVLGVYLVIQVGLGVVIIVISSLQLRILNKSPKSPTGGFYLKLATMRKRCGKNKANKVMGSKSGLSEKEISMRDEKESSTVSWNDVVKTIDYICFWSFIIIYAFINVVTFAILTKEH